jgi:hypothetical protein
MLPSQLGLGLLVIIQIRITPSRTPQAACPRRSSMSSSPPPLRLAADFLSASAVPDAGHSRTIHSISSGCALVLVAADILRASTHTDEGQRASTCIPRTVALADYSDADIGSINVEIGQIV